MKLFLIRSRVALLGTVFETAPNWFHRVLLENKQHGARRETGGLTYCHTRSYGILNFGFIQALFGLTAPITYNANPFSGLLLQMPDTD